MSYLQRGITERLEQGHLSRLKLSLKVPPPEDLVVVQVDDGLILVQSYSLVQVLPVLLHSPGSVLHYAGPHTDIFMVRGVQLGTPVI